MAITVKKLIQYLEKAPNKYAEVEVLVDARAEYSKELDEEIKVIPGKVQLIVKAPKKYLRRSSCQSIE